MYNLELQVIMRLVANIVFICYELVMEDYPFLTQAVSVVLKKLREEAGFSKRKLAMNSGVDRVYLLQVEQGKYRPTLNFIFHLARALNIPAAKLVDLIEKEQRSSGKKTRVHEEQEG